MALVLTTPRLRAAPCCPIAKNTRDNSRPAGQVGTHLGGTAGARSRPHRLRSVPVRRQSLGQVQEPVSPPVYADSAAFEVERHSLTATANATRIWQYPAMPGGAAIAEKLHRNRHIASSARVLQHVSSAFLPIDSSHFWTLSSLRGFLFSSLSVEFWPKLGLAALLRSEGGRDFAEVRETEGPASVRGDPAHARRLLA
jgi:hypothetical protein